jgi:hypothetical protein
MNLWDKTLKMILVVLGSSLFFIACKEELNNVGKDLSGEQFDLLYKEFTLPSRVIIDSVNTSGVGLLAGTYVDPEFGTVTSVAYAEFVGTVGRDISSDKFIFDSLKVSLRLNSYCYGENSNIPIIFSIHELTEEIPDASLITNFTDVGYNLEPLGQASYTLDKEEHEALTTDVLLTIDLTDSYFQRIQDSLRVIQNDISKHSTLAISPETGFYGFAILANGDNVVGINTTSAMSIIYHTLEDGIHKDTTSYTYSFSNTRYNRITSDRSGTAIADAVPNTPFLPENNMRYFQSGTGVSTELDFALFLEFFKDIPNVVFNSVGISLGEIKETESFSAPDALAMEQSDENSLTSPLEVSSTELPFVISDNVLQQELLLTIESENYGVYLGLPTSYFQFITNEQVERSTVILRPSDNNNSAINGYTVDRFVIHQDSIKLKVYYTLPK